MYIHTKINHTYRYCGLIILTNHTEYIIITETLTNAIYEFENGVFNLHVTSNHVFFKLLYVIRVSFKIYTSIYIILIK